MKMRVKDAWNELTILAHTSLVPYNKTSSEKETPLPAMQQMQLADNIVKDDAKDLMNYPIGSKFICVGSREPLYNSSFIHPQSDLVKLQNDYWELTDENDVDMLKIIVCAEAKGLCNEGFAYYCYPNDNGIEKDITLIKNNLEEQKLLFKNNILV